MSLGLVGKVGEGVGGPSGGESVGGMAGGETDSSLPVMVLGGAARVDELGTGCEPAEDGRAGRGAVAAAELADGAVDCVARERQLDLE